MSNRAKLVVELIVTGAFLLTACGSAAQVLNIDGENQTSLKSTELESTTAAKAQTPTGSVAKTTPESSQGENTAGIVEAEATERTYEIVTLLPLDAIPAIDNPQFYSAADANAEYDPDELVLGITINGESKAYSTSHLDRHEIVNDILGGRKIAVTW